MALEKTGSDRAAFLNAVGADDSALCARLKALLAAHEQKDGVLTEPVELVCPTRNQELPEASPDEAVGQTIGRYKLLEKVGEGGCGVVYVAQQTEPVRRRVALKVIKLGMDTKAVVVRFEAERQALALMDHPNIAKVFDAGSTDTGRPYFVMELVRGIKITDYCDQNNLATQQRLELFMQVCRAVQHAHQKGIIHRDIKPSNILVTLHDGVPVPKVIDFGIAKATEGRLTDATVYTQLHQLLGTPAYMSPEQAEMSGLDVDTRSDIYSLGVLLYELLTGRTPFDAKELISAGIEAMRRTIRETEPVRPSTRLASLKAEELTMTAKRRSLVPPRLISLLKGDLDWIVMRCLEKDRTRRYDTATSLEHDLRRHLMDEPVEAGPPSKIYRLRKLLVRHKVQVAFGSGFVALLVTALALALAAAKTQARFRKVAESNSRISEARRLFTEANQAAVTHPQRALLLLVEALRVHLDHGEQLAPGSEQALLRSLTNISGFCLQASPGGLESVQVSQDGRWVAAGGARGEVLLWDLESPNLRESVRVLRHTTNAVSALSISPNGERLASGDAQGSLTVWRLGPNGVASSQELPLHTNRINAVLFSHQSRWLVSGCENGVVGLWDLSGEAVPANARVFVNEASAITALAITKKSGLLLLADSAGQVSVLQLPALNLFARSGVTSRRTRRINAICLREDDGEFATASEDRTVRRWRLDPAGKTDFLTALKGHSSSVTAGAYDSRGRLITGGADGKVLLWNASAANTNSTLLTSHHNFATSIGYDYKGTGYAVTSGRLWSDSDPNAFTRYAKGMALMEEVQSAIPEDWEAYLDPLASLRSPAQPINLRMVVSNEGSSESPVGGVTSIRVSSDGSRLVTSGCDGCVVVTQGSRTVILRGHEGPVTSVAMNATGDLIASSGWDGSVRIWASQELRAKLRSLKPVFEIDQGIRAELGNVTGKKSAVLDRSAFARQLFALARDRTGRNFTKEEWQHFFPGRDYRKTFDELSVPAR